MDKVFKFNELPNIDSILSILGLVFPESATEFQKAALTLAHLTASLRDYVLKMRPVPVDMVDLINQLAIMMDDNVYHQLKDDEPVNVAK